MPGDVDQFMIACLDGTSTVPFSVFRSSLRLMVTQVIQVEGDKCHTVHYAYRVATGDAKADWLLRWEYFREPPTAGYPYPPAHVHINAALIDASTEERLAKPAPYLHVPTARVPLELVLWHLIAEWGVQPRTDDWQQFLAESIAGFEERRTAP